MESPELVQCHPERVFDIMAVKWFTAVPTGQCAERRRRPAPLAPDARYLRGIKRQD
jgi:hypothetical protein